MMNKSYYENIFASMVDGVLVVDENYHLSVFNQAMENLLEVPISKVIGKPVSQLFTSFPALRDILPQVIEKGETYSDSDSSITRPNGEKFSIGVVASPLTGESGRISGGVVAVRNISYAKELEEREMLGNKLASLEMVCLGVAHELMNPLVGIRGAAQLLKERTRDERAQECTRVIISEVDRLTRILGSLRELSLPCTLSRSPTNIHQVLDEVLFLLKGSFEEKGARWVKDYDPSIPEMNLDGGRLSQVLLNLVKNGLEAVGEGGEVCLTTKVSEYRVTSRSSSKTLVPMVLIEVKDNGDGMSEEEVKRLFTPLHTTKTGGSGLGLVISHNIIREHGGIIKVESRKGTGTAVKVYLPMG